MSIQDIQENPQDTSNFFLANIYKATIDPNSSTISTSPPLSPPPFSPPNHAVWVNALWFMSLVISLTCALLATLLQQWARRYLKITQSRYQPHKRARIHAFYAEGVEKCLLPWTVDALPTLLHLSLFLFFAGLVVFLCNVNLTCFKSVLSWVALCVTLYGCITCMPIIRHDSPYYTPLSLPTWHVVTLTLIFVYRFLRWFSDLFCCWGAYYRLLDLEKSYRESLARGMQKTAEETALKMSSEFDPRIFKWTFDCLDEDHELESFFSGLPGFRSSTIVEDPVPTLSDEEMWKLYGALHGLLHRTFSSDLLPASVKDRRAMIGAKAIDREHTPNASILYAILFKYQHSGPVVTKITNILKEYGNSFDKDNVSLAQVDISKIFAVRQSYGDSWYILASYELGFYEAFLREYAAQGDSLSFVILIHLVRQQFIRFRKMSFSQTVHFSTVLSWASHFDANDTSSELQHEFCALWNQIVHKAQGGNDEDWDMARFILRPIRNVFLSLHKDTDSAPTQFSASTDEQDVILEEPSSYPLCNSSHHSGSPHTHDEGVSTTLTRAIPREPNDDASVPSITSPHPSPSHTHAPLPVSNDALTLDNRLSVPTSTQVTGRTITEGRRIPTISPSPVIEPSRTTQPSTSSPSPKPNASASPPDDIAVGHSALSHARSDDINVRLSPSPTPVLDSILPTGLLSFQAATQSDLSFVYSSNCR